MNSIKRVVLVQPKSVGGNFEYVAIPRQGLLFLSGALAQWKGTFLYEREIWFEDRSGKIDPKTDLDGVDILMVTALINEAPRAYEIARLAKLYHPELITIGGGPHMSPLSDEALREGGLDVVVNREGEDIVGQLCDVLLTFKGTDRERELLKIPGISFMSEGHLLQTPRRGVIAPDFVELPDFYSIKDLTSLNPLAGGVIETVRGCTEKCTYCQVIQQFLGYRMVRRETELRRLQQLRELAADGLVHTSRDGRFAVFISDDLHPPPLRAVKFRNERLERIKSWKGHTDGMYLICQTRAEIGQDPELANALREIGVDMLYVGVESDNVKNLEAVKKRQEPGQVYKDLTYLNQLGFNVVAMTIIGLPFDTEEGIMNMAKWVREISKYQTANLLTPLPATSNWTTLTPLDEDGSLLPEGKMRPYHLYTGRQFVHLDHRWSMEESRQLFNRYHAKLNPVDNLYARMFRLLQRNQLRLAHASSELTTNISTYINRIGESLKLLADSASKDLTGNISARINELSETLRAFTDSAGKGLTESVSVHINRISDTLRTLTDSASKGLTENIAPRLNHMGETLRILANPNLSRKRAYSDE